MNIDQEGNRPKLKKIKRPINRTAPMNAYSNSQASIPSQDNRMNMQNQSAVNEARQPLASPAQTKSYSQSPNSKELNEYLDSSRNVPDVRYGQDEYSPNYIDDEDLYYEPPYQSVPEWLNVKVFVISIIFFMVLGVLCGKFLFSQSAVVHNGLQGVVVNTEVPRGRARCGIAERSQGCVLYIMNPQRHEMTAKDFYDFAAQMTGRQRFMIETGNMRYANSRIKPGEIAQLNIPPL